MARAITRAAGFTSSACPADVQGAHGLYCMPLFLAHARPRWRVAFRKSPVGQLFYEFFGENTLRSDIRVGGTGRVVARSYGADRRRPARIFGSDETLRGRRYLTANKIVWHGTVSKNDLVLCDRNAKSILHSLVMTGATPVYLVPSRRVGDHRTDLARPVTQVDRQKIAGNPFQGCEGGSV
jgi:arginine decarboxylase